MKRQTPTPSLRKKGLHSYLGVDPGASGGIALLDHNGKINYLEAMPDDEIGMWELITSCIRGTVFCCIEQVGGWTGGRAGYAGNQAPGSAMFNFGWNYGGLRMALIGNGLIEDVTLFPTPPTRWQNGLGIEPRMTKVRAKKARKVEESKAQFKRRLKQEATNLFPKEKVTMNTCDALLIAEYCRLTYS